MIRETLAVGLLQCNCTVLGDETSREAIVVDPGYDVPRILMVLAKHQLTVKQIVVTHAHIDHIASAQSLKAITGAPVFYNKADLPLVAMMEMQAELVGLAVPDVRPPDHSPGSVCLYVPEESLLLAGDTLFAGCVGRSDWPGGNGQQLIASIHERLMPLPDDTVVVPGHGPATTVGVEREENPFLQQG